MRLSIAKHAGHVVLRSDVAGLAGPSQLSHALNGLINEGVLIRLALGIFGKAETDAATGKSVLQADLEQVSNEVSTKLGAPFRVVRADSGEDKWSLVRGGKSSARRNERGPSHRGCKLPGSVMLPMEVDKLPTRDVGNIVKKFAEQHHVKYKRTHLDDWAQAVTRAAGDDVQLDDTGNLLVALKKKNLID